MTLTVRMVLSVAISVSTLARRNEHGTSTSWVYCSRAAGCLDSAIWHFYHLPYFCHHDERQINCWKLKSLVHNRNLDKNHQLKMCFLQMEGHHSRVIKNLERDLSVLYICLNKNNEIFVEHDTLCLGRHFLCCILYLKFDAIKCVYMHDQSCSTMWPKGRGDWLVVVRRCVGRIGMQTVGLCRAPLMMQFDASKWVG